MNKHDYRKNNDHRVPFYFAFFLVAIATSPAWMIFILAIIGGWGR